VIIGIDAGVQTGIAIFENQKLIQLKTLTPYQAVCFFQENIGKITKAVIEYSKGQSYIFNKRAGMNERVIGRLGRNIGQVDGLCELFIECLESNKIKVHKYTPLKKGSKWNQEAFLQCFPYWKGSTNEHKRDAVKIVFKFDHHLHPF
jgi:hypothetical protein